MTLSGVNKRTGRLYNTRGGATMNGGPDEVQRYAEIDSNDTEASIKEPLTLITLRPVFIHVHIFPGR